MARRVIRIAIGMLMLVTFGHGCGAPPAAPPAPGESAAALRDSSVLDAAALERALTNQDRLEAAGHELIGRAWLSERSYVGYYAAAGDDLRIVRFVAPEDLERAQGSEPLEHEAFQDYVARLDADGAERLIDLDRDLLLFSPSDLTEHGDPVAVTQAALLPLEEIALHLQRCRDSTRSWCARTPGYVFFGRGPEAVSRWDRFQVHSHVAVARGTSQITGVCAHANGATIDHRYSNADWGSPATNFALDIGPLEQYAEWFIAGWREPRECWWNNIFGTCTEWAFRMQFQKMDMWLSVAGRNGGIFHSYCGVITQNVNLNRVGLPRDANCAKRGICPVDSTY
jgi:hypothetical protein